MWPSLPAPPCRCRPPLRALPSRHPTPRTYRGFARYNLSMWLSAIVLLVWCVCDCHPSCHWFVAGFGYLTVQGRCCRNLQLTLLCSFVAGEAIARIIPHRPRLVTLQDSKVRHPTPLFPYHVHISRNLARRLPFERDTVGNMQIFAYL